MSPKGDLRSLVKQQTCRKTAFDLPQVRREPGDDADDEDFGDLLGNSKTTFVKMAQQSKPATVRCYAAPPPGVVPDIVRYIQAHPVHQ